MIKLNAFVKKCDDIEIYTGLCTPCRSIGKETNATKLTCVGYLHNQKQDWPVNVCDECANLSADEIMLAAMIIVTTVAGNEQRLKEVCAA